MFQPRGVLQTPPDRRDEIDAIIDPIRREAALLAHITELYDYIEILKTQSDHHRASLGQSQLHRSPELDKFQNRVRKLEEQLEALQKENEMEGYSPSRR